MVNITGTYKLKKQTQKKHKAPLLPGDALLLRQIESETDKRRQARQSEKLEDRGSSKPEWQRESGTDFFGLLDSILERMWTPVPDKLRSKAQVEQDRKIPQMIMASHLYGIYAHNTTLVDRTLRSCAQQGSLFVLQVEIPGVNETIIQSKHLEHPLKDRLSSTSLFTAKDLTGHDISALITAGYLTKDPLRGGYSVAVPRQGAAIRLVLAGRKWLEKTLRAQKWKELPEPQLEEKLERSTGYWKDLKGISLEWILYDAVGTGLVEAFDTPIGRGWKLAR